jgi:2-dehydropantoate 2-reductase
VRYIRDEIWVKLWGNLCFNPISALTQATLDVIATDPGTRGVARKMMLEAKDIGEKLGVNFRVDVEKRINGAADVGAHTTSMLQDLQLGRPMEIDALLTAVQELGRIVDVPTPTIDVVLSLVQQRARVAGCY